MIISYFLFLSYPCVEMNFS